MAFRYNALDTNVLIYLLVEKSDNHRKALDLIKNAFDKQFIIEDQAIIEMAYVFERALKKKREFICEAIEAIIYEPAFVCHKETFKRVLPLYISHPKLSFVDCFLGVRANEEDAVPLWTFDKKLANQLSFASVA